MAYSEEQWERTKALFESGQYSLSEISDKTGINKSQISRKSKMQQWESGKNSDYIEAREIIATKKATETQQTLQVLDDVADEVIRHKRLVYGLTEKILNNIDKSVSQKIVVKNEDGTEKEEDILLDSKSAKEYIEAIDKASLTLGVNQRHAPRMDVTQMQAVQASGTTKIEIIEDRAVND